MKAIEYYKKSLEIRKKIYNTENQLETAEVSTYFLYNY